MHPMWRLASPGLQLDAGPAGGVAVGGETSGMAEVVDNTAAAVTGGKASLWGSGVSDGGIGAAETGAGSTATIGPSALTPAAVGAALALAVAVALVPTATAVGAVGLSDGAPTVGGARTSNWVCIHNYW